MTPYLILASFPVAFYVFYNTCSKKAVNTSQEQKKYFLFFCGALLFALVALRNKYIGSSDSLNYYRNWEMIRSISAGAIDDFIESSPMETGYVLTVWVLSHIAAPPQFLFVFSGLLFTVAVCNFIYKNCEDVMLGFLMYVTLGLYSFMVQGLRQAIAMSICLFSIEFVKKRKFIPFILIVLLATTYHKSAIVFAIVYFLYGIKMDIKGYFLGLLGSAAVIGLGPVWVSIANQQFDREYEGVVEQGGFIATAIYLIILFVAIVFGRGKKTDKNFAFFFFFTLLGCVTYIMRYTDVVIAERVSYYFAFGQMIVLPSVLQNLPKSERIAVKVILIIVCLALFVYRMAPTNLAPYRFFWQGVGLF